ncbi:hypothetical protein KCU71_g104, partial [Aureobasidium melanogenum]
MNRFLRTSCGLSANPEQTTSSMQRTRQLNCLATTTTRTLLRSVASTRISCYLWLGQTMNQHWTLSYNKLYRD